MDSELEFIDGDPIPEWPRDMTFERVVNIGEHTFFLQAFQMT